MTAEQGTMFGALGDADADALTYRTDDGAQVEAPSLFQQGRDASRAQLEADREAALFVTDHRAHVAENAALTTTGSPDPETT